MSQLSKEWEDAQRDLSLEIVAPFELEIQPGIILHAVLLLRNFGARIGMLIIKDYKAFKPYFQQLEEQGYGLCVMHEVDENGVYDRDSFIQMLSDWSWSGPDDRKPPWIIDFVD